MQIPRRSNRQSIPQRQRHSRARRRSRDTKGDDLGFGNWGGQDQSVV